MLYVTVGDHPASVENPGADESVAEHAGLPEPICPECGHTVPIVFSRDREGLHWARHTIAGSLTAPRGAQECDNSGSEWEDPKLTSWTPGNQGW
ncbi:Uncharacterised protein [Mycobacteroides abscessus subsp. massiliense]|nr:Uncharacterised protein [Mycobacteroides abscessus subsp. massiliense]